MDMPSRRYPKQFHLLSNFPSPVDFLHLLRKSVCRYCRTGKQSSDHSWGRQITWGCGACREKNESIPGLSRLAETWRSRKETCPKGWKHASVRCCPRGRAPQSCSLLQESQVGPQHLSKFLRYQGRFDPKVPSDYFLALL